MALQISNTFQISTSTSTWDHSDICCKLIPKSYCFHSAFSSSTDFKLRTSKAALHKLSSPRIICQAVEEPKRVSAAEAARIAEEMKDVGMPLAWDADKRAPIRPASWDAAEENRIAAQTELRDGVAIRRRPPMGPSEHAVGPFQFRIESEENQPRNILEEIVWHKDVEVAAFKEKMPLISLLKALQSSAASGGPARDFVGALRQRLAETGVPALIAEVKKASPSRGIIQPDFDPVRIAKAYEKGGAACLSVLTDSKYFQGSFENLKLIRAAGVQCPLLCKEFIVDAWQLYNARLHGADAVLLIASVLPNQDLKYFIKIAKNLGLASLIEVHTEQEMDRVLGLEGVELIGINNRDLGTFKVDINNTKVLLEGKRGEEIKKRGIIVVGESGLFTPEDVAVVQNAGCKAILVGESLVKQNDPAAGITGLFGKDISRTLV